MLIMIMYTRKWILFRAGLEYVCKIFSEKVHVLVLDVVITYIITMILICYPETTYLELAHELTWKKTHVDEEDILWQNNHSIKLSNIYSGFHE